jgi:hypothetical protein
MIYYLKFNSEQEFQDVLIAILEQELIDKSSFEVHGQISRETGTILTDEDGNEFPEMLPVEGYHADLTLADDIELPSELTDYVIPTPDNPIHRLR